ncbi:MAG: Uncharacterised protein [Opitutia bacterium UBA7350]|nr:MAG: Uncharacterised protein [Opitutae bacterium UBA7350]
MNRFFYLALLGATVALLAQPRPDGPPRMLAHTITESRKWQPIPATEPPPYASQQSFKKNSRTLVVNANAIPEHKVGQFPNRRNPHTIREQKLAFNLPLNPVPLKEPVPLHNDSGRGAPNTPFGIAANGVLFDPGTAEFYLGDRNADWNYEALSGSVILGLDVHHAHVQPNGSYHYHGLPTGLLKRLKLQPDTHSPLIGFAMDGFPIYALYGYRDARDSKSPIVKLRSSWQLKRGERPSNGSNPGGRYDGTFSKDYEYIQGSGDLDECNGRFTRTKEFPKGTYAYFLTEDWPVIPRYFRAQPLKLRGERPPRR